jgi:hypothetical protein
MSTDPPSDCVCKLLGRLRDTDDIPEIFDKVINDAYDPNDTDAPSLPAVVTTDHGPPRDIRVFVWVVQEHTTCIRLETEPAAHAIADV